MLIFHNSSQKTDFMFYYAKKRHLILSEFRRISAHFICLLENPEVWKQQQALHILDTTFRLNKGPKSCFHSHCIHEADYNNPVVSYMLRPGPPLYSNHRQPSKWKCRGPLRYWHRLQKIPRWTISVPDRSRDNSHRRLGNWQKWLFFPLSGENNWRVLAVFPNILLFETLWYSAWINMILTAGIFLQKRNKRVSIQSRVICQAFGNSFIVWS